MSFAVFETDNAEFWLMKPLLSSLDLARDQSLPGQSHEKLAIERQKVGKEKPAPGGAGVERPGAAIGSPANT